jgi:hypothetical protein
MLTKEQIDKNIDWLLNHAGAPVRYLTRRHLNAENIDSSQMRQLWREVERDRDVIDIFAKQKTDGSWCAGGAWAPPPSYSPKGGCSPVSPKYVTTTWILPILGDMGFTIQDKRIRKACEYVFSFQCRNGFIAEVNKERYEVDAAALHNMPCRFSIMLIGFGKVGAGKDPRVTKAYDLLARWQRDDGGWVLQKHKEEQNWTRSCPWSTFHATYALYSSKNDKYKRNWVNGLNFLLRHLSQKNPDEIKRFFYHGHSTVHELLMISDAGIGKSAEPVALLLDWFLEMYDRKEGCFVYKGKPVSKHSYRKDGMDSRVAKYRLYHLIERDWLTYYLTKVALNMTG